MIKSCKSSMPHSARWRHFLGKGRDVAIPGAEILKRRLSSEKWLGMTYSSHLTSQNNRNNSTASTAVLALFSPFIQRLHLYHATRIPIHSLIISCLDYWNNVCAKLLFFSHTLQGHSELPYLLCFSLQYPCCSHPFLPHSYSPMYVQLHMKSILEVQCITAIIQEPQGNRLQPSVYSPVHLLSLYHSCYPNTPSFFCMFKI